MTCAACEARVGKSLRKLPGVEEAKASVAKSSVTVVTSGPAPLDQIDQALQRAGYKLGAAALPAVSRDRAVWRDAAVAAVGVILLLMGAHALGLGSLTDRLSAGQAAGSLIVVFALGVVASVSTCMALVGGLVLSVSAAFAKAHPEARPGTAVRPQFMFNLGRIGSFALLGAVLGAVGSALHLGGHWLAIATIAVALVMGAVGLRLTGLSPRISRVSLSLPAGAARWTGRFEGQTGYRDWHALGLGAASFFLPCGFTQAVQIYALGTGDPLQAGLVMAVFALGTAPGLFSVGAAAALIRGRAAPHIFRAVGVLVIAFALVNITGAVRALQPALGAPTALATARSDNVTDDGDVQILRTTQTGVGYSPKQAAVYAGRPVRWEIQSEELSCASSMNLEAMGLGTVNLELGLNVFEFTPTKVGTLAYTCGMGMWPASIQVLPDPEESTGPPSPASRRETDEFDR
jgi:sulfite exporter TauE/SafE/copper chaperone CopZ